MSTIPSLTLNDGKSIPQLGLGVWQVPEEQVGGAVTEALRAGYRHIDTAQGYANEAGVGKAIAESGLERKDVYVTSKLRTRDQGYDQTLKSFMGSLDRLGLDHLDLFLIHWPVPGEDKYSDTWKAFVQLQRDGRIHSIGVSNFLPDHLERIIGDTGVAPAVNQIELHPYFQQQQVRDFHQHNKIVIESYSPLGSGAVLDDKVIAEIADKHGKTPAQAIIRWHLQQDLVVIPKSVHAERIRANADVFDFELDAEDLEKFAALDKGEGGRQGSDPATNNAIW